MKTMYIVLALTICLCMTGTVSANTDIVEHGPMISDGHYLLSKITDNPIPIVATSKNWPGNHKKSTHHAHEHGSK